jgi:hypothetical protein
MFRKSTILSLAAAATLGVLAISTTSASAFHFGGGARAGGMHFGGAHFGARVAGPHLGIRNFGFRRVVRVFPPHHHWHWRWHHIGWRPYWVAPVAAAGIATSVAPAYAATPACNCLTKSYTQDGAVVFKDLCTKEMAMNPPASPAPIQQGYLQPTQ